jgi:adenosylcobinamide-phosphate synthase
MVGPSSPGAAAVGLVLDRLFGEPPAHLHPVSRFGAAMTTCERRLWRDSRLAGSAYAAIGTGLGAAVGAGAGSTAATAVAVAGRELRRIAHHIAAVTSSGDLGSARVELKALVGRDTSELDASGIAAAVIESLAENSVDAVFAPALWAAVGGGAAAGAYRAINTMDAMVGHRSDRYARFGWAAARADDLANWVPARVFALAVVAVRPGRATEVWRAVRDDAPGHPSPNAGVAEAAVAAALGRQLGGPLRYGTRPEARPTLGHGPRPVLADIGAAIRLTDHAERLLVGCLLALAARRRWRP